MKKKSVLDAYALLAYLTKESGHARIKDLLASIVQPDPRPRRHDPAAKACPLLP